jgi:hypothetical protein
MMVYIESNFVLEIALEQEQYSSAEAILKLADSLHHRPSYLDDLVAQLCGLLEL